VSLKVLPVARGTRTITRRIDAQDAIGLLGAAVQRGIPITAVSGTPISCMCAWKVPRPGWMK